MKYLVFYHIAKKGAHDVYSMSGNLNYEVPDGINTFEDLYKLREFALSCIKEITPSIQDGSLILNADDIAIPNIMRLPI